MHYNTYFMNCQSFMLSNAIDYLSRLWKVKIEKSEELKFLLDIRTLIVHSGEKNN